MQETDLCRKVRTGYGRKTTESGTRNLLSGSRSWNHCPVDQQFYVGIKKPDKKINQCLTQIIGHVHIKTKGEKTDNILFILDEISLTK